MALAKTYSVRTILFLCLLQKYIDPGAEAKRAKRIVGGEDVKENEIRYQASLKVHGTHVCQGTIISPKHILTAAHCVANFGFESPFEELNVVTGSTSLKSDGNSHQVFDIRWHDRFVNGPEDSWYNDIAIVTLVDEIEIDKTQSPAFLPDFPAPNGVPGVISGWGRRDPANPWPSKILQKAVVQVLDREECEKKMKRHLRDGQICGFVDEKTGICNGDSGGALVVNETIVGIASWNIACASGKPDVFTDVYENLDFIEGVIKHRIPTRRPGSK